MTQAMLGVWAVSIVAFALLRPRALPALAVVMCVFEGTALFKAGGMAISPYYLVALLIAGRCLIEKMTRQDWLGRTPQVRSVLTTMVIFTLVALAGAVVLPRIFAGTQVRQPRLSEEGTAGLVFSTSNIGQGVYLGLSLLLMWYAARQNPPERTAKAMGNAVVIAGVIVVGLGIYQFAAAFTGLPFPDDLLYSNDSYTMQAGTQVGDMPRISSTFTEPAGMAVFLLGLLGFLTSDVGKEAGGIIRIPLLAGAVAVTLLSTSTTAYVGLGVIGAWRLGPSLILPAIQGKLNWKTSAMTIGGMMAVVAAVALSPELRELIQKMVFEKNQSASFDDRSDANAHGWQLVIETLGLGTGLGSNRASGFLPSMFSTVGIYGGGLFLLVIVLLNRKPANESVRPMHRALVACLLGIVLAKMISGPDLSTPSMWVMMAALLATHAVPARETMAEAASIETIEAFVPRRHAFDRPSMGALETGANV